MFQCVTSALECTMSCPVWHPGLTKNNQKILKTHCFQSAYLTT